MTVVSSKDFAINQDKYFDMALDEDVCIKKGGSMFHLIYSPVEKQYPEQPVLEPDDVFRSAIPMGEFRKRAAETVKKVHNRYTNERNHIAAGA
jgi:hypothetical protein